MVTMLPALPVTLPAQKYECLISHIEPYMTRVVSMLINNNVYK